MTKEPSTEEYAKQTTEKWECELVRRLEAGEYLGRTDRKEAIRLQKIRASKDRGLTAP